MPWIDLITLLATIATLASVIVAVVTLIETKRIAQAALEDDLVREYREIIHRIPVNALAGKKAANYRKIDALNDVYSYVDFTNEQILLRSKRRIRDSTWNEWVIGIKANYQANLIMESWSDIQQLFPNSFNELKKFEKSGFKNDPKSW